MWRATSTLVDLQWGLPGVFPHNHVGDAVNGPLWTLRPEVQMYGSLLLLGIVAAAGGAALSRYRAAVVGTGMIAAIAWGWATHGDLAGHGLEPSSLSRLAPYFGLGALLYIARRAVPITLVAPAVAWAVAIASRGTSLFAPAFAIGVALTTVWLAYSNLGSLRRWGRFGDFSYGLYIYAFPVQQTLIASVSVMASSRALRRRLRRDLVVRGVVVAASRSAVALAQEAILELDSATPPALRTVTET